MTKVFEKFSAMGLLAICTVLSMLLFASPAKASDASDGQMAWDASGSDDGGPTSDEPSGPPVACDGALCDTSNGATCGIARGRIGHAPTQPKWLAGFAALLLAGAMRQASRRFRAPYRKARCILAGTGFIAVLATDRTSVAQPAASMDVVIRDPSPPRRLLALEWNPLPLVTLGKLSANVVVVPIDHHAIVVSPFYASASTEPIYVYDDAGNPTQLPRQLFRGFGTEIGYRYYAGLGGPRGFFAGPSLLLASFKATAANASQTRFSDLGFAADIGYEALIADGLAISLGGGLQYVTTSTSIPDQQFPAQVYANRGLRPRFLVSLGWAL